MSDKKKRKKLDNELDYMERIRNMEKKNNLTFIENDGFNNTCYNLRNLLDECINDTSTSTSSDESDPEDWDPVDWRNATNGLIKRSNGIVHRLQHTIKDGELYNNY